jgi:hypothetical protein
MTVCLIDNHDYAVINATITLTDCFAWICNAHYHAETTKNFDTFDLGLRIHVVSGFPGQVVNIDLRNSAGQSCEVRWPLNSYVACPLEVAGEYAIGVRSLPAPGGGVTDCLSTAQPARIFDNGNVNLQWVSDGNLAVYRNGSGPIWSSNTNGRGARLCFQGDGNLVIYDASSAIWASRTDGDSGSQMALKTNCDLVVRDSSGAERFHTWTYCTP